MKTCLLLNARSIFSVIVLLTFSFSCKFQPSEIPETIINPPDENAPIIYIEVQPDMDTLKLASDVWTDFKVTSPKSEIKWVKISFDDLVLYDFEYIPEARPKFYISVGSHSNGLHHFYIQVFTSSNSGSIADRIGAEGYVYEVVWPVIIKYTFDRSIKIKNIEYLNGPVKIEYTKYDYYDFQFYKISRISDIQKNEIQYIVSEPLITNAIDSTYLEGEYAAYKVSLNDEFNWQWTVFDVPVPTPEITFESENNLKVKWRKTKNRKQLGYYHVAMKVPDTNFYQEIINENADDTVAVYNASPMFGDYYEFQIRYVPKNFSEPYINYNSSGGKAMYSLGNKMKAFENAIQLGNSAKVLLYNDNMFYKYDMANNAVIDSFKVNSVVLPEHIKVSPKGEFFGYFVNPSLASSDFVMRKTSDWSVVNQFYVPIVNGNAAGFWSISISDNYHLVVVQHGNVLTVTDIKLGKEIYRKVGKNGEQFLEAVVNSEGNRILYNKNIYEKYKNYLTMVDFDGLKFTQLGETETAIEGAVYPVVKYGFAGDEVLLLKAVSTYDYIWEERSADDFALLKEQDLVQDFVPVAIDFNKKQLVVRYGRSGSINNAYSWYYDIENGTSDKITPIVRGQKFMLINELLANGSGRYLPINALKLK